MHCFRLFALAVCLLVIYALGPCGIAVAQSERQVSTSHAPTDTSSPRSTLKGFIDTCNEAYEIVQRDRFVRREHSEQRMIVRRILDCLDDSRLPEYARDYRAAEVATCIKEILDRVEIPPYNEIPDAEEIANRPNGLDRWQVPGTRLTIVRMTDGPRKHEYLFSSGTVSRATEYFEDIKSLPYRVDGPDTSPHFHRWYVTAANGPMIGALVNWLPDWSLTRKYGLAVWKWIALIITTVGSLLVLGLLYYGQRKFSLRYHDEYPGKYFLTAIFPLLAFLVPVAYRHIIFNAVALRGMWLYSVTFAANIAQLLISLVLVFSLVNRVTAWIISSPKINPQGLDAQVIRILSKIIALTLSVLVFLEIGQYLGIPVTTLLASAGVGGLAVALAAQDTLKNLFGTIMLMADKPFRVGDRISVDSYDGVVEDIGLRSTRIRLLTGHQVTIPNDTLARVDIENIGRRPFIRRASSIRFPLNTPSSKINKAIEIVRDELTDHEGMTEDFPPRVFFDEFNDDSFNLRIFYWYHPANYWDFLAFTERLNLDIMRRFEAEEIEFSLPTRLAYASIDGRDSTNPANSVQPPRDDQ